MTIVYITSILNDNVVCTYLRDERVFIMDQIRRFIALLLIGCIVISFATCSVMSAAYFEGPAAPSTLNLDGAVDLNTETTANEKDELSREELEVIVDVLGEDVDTDKLTDAELSNLADDLLNSLENDEESGAVDLSANKDAYDENGAMTRPFDEVYPELIENGSVEFDDETILIKLSNKQGGKITAAMAKAGVVKLESIVPLEEETWYKANLKAGTDASVALEEIRVLKDVILAEYDYIIKTAEIDCYKDFDDSHNFDKNKHKKDQWYMHHCGIPDGYSDMTADGGSASVIVAVIDTGVDVDHEDLKDNIWKNTAETPDNGIDDDGNGYIDDYYGVNIVAGKGNGDDDNGHGTHVAGIIAAQNNNLGTVGIAYNTTIMPVKAAMASGYLHDSDIAKAVLYAYEHGAEVINMSFGGTSCSIAVQDALATAYTRCVLVASAGNNGKCNEGIGAVPNYPAALTYVLGVMAVDKNGTETYFTNWDLVSFSGSEYELYAPGYDIMSTLPDDRYGSLSGTSMAAPMVSAMAAILRSEFTDRDTYPTKFIYGQLSATSDHYATCNGSHGTHNLPQIVNLHSALTKLPNPDVGVQDYTLFDTQGLSEDVAGANNGDGVIDAGETISLGLILRNRWGMSKNTKVTLDTKSMAGISDPYVTIVNPTVNYDSVGTYSAQDCGKVYTDELHTGWENPFIIKIADDCPNDYIVKVNVTLEYENGLDENDKTVYSNLPDVPISFTFTIRNGVILPSIIEEDMSLTSDNLYIIPNSTVIKSGVTVKAGPGTKIQFWNDDPNDPYADSYIAYLQIYGSFIAQGTKEAPICIYPSDLMSDHVIEMNAEATGSIVLEYVDFTNLAYATNNNNLGSLTNNKISYADHCTFRMSSDGYKYSRYLTSGNVLTQKFASFGIANFDLVKNSVFYRIGKNARLYGKADRCIFVDCSIAHNEATQNCVFLGNSFESQENPGTISQSTMTMSTYTDITSDTLRVHYNETTGTTYVFSNIKFDELMLDKLGGHGLIVNDKEEVEFLAKKCHYSTAYDVGMYYDAKKQKYLWCDGSEIPEFLDYKNNLLSSGEKYSYPIGVYLLSGGTIGYIDKVNSSYYLYEFSGRILPTEITLPEYELKLDTGTTYQLNPISAPIPYTNGEFVYESRDTSIAKVDKSGLITPVGNGVTDIYVYSEDKAVCNYVTVNVTDYVALEDFSFTPEDTIIAEGETVKSDAVFAPLNTTRTSISYSSSDSSVVRVDVYGNLFGVSSGNATITALCEGVEKTVQVKVFKKATTFELETPAMLAAIAEGSVKLPQVITPEGSETNIVWRVLDESVAEIVDGRVVLNAIGATTLEAIDLNSGARTDCSLIVQEEVSAIKDLQISWISYTSDNTVFDRFYYLWLENGDLYYWSTGQPVLNMQNVEMFSGFRGGFFALTKDGTLAQYSANSSGQALRGSTFTYFNADEIADIEYCGHYFVLLKNGTAFAWGNNSEGQLGIGSTVSPTEPILVNLDAKIVDIFAREVFTYFLTENGDLYAAGRNTGSTPIYLTSGIKKIFKDQSRGIYDFGCIVLSEDDILLDAYQNGVSGCCEGFSFEGYDVQYYYDHQTIAIKNGEVYKFKFDWRGFEPYTVERIPGIYNATKVFGFRYSNYIVINDTVLAGEGENNQTMCNDFPGVPAGTISSPAQIVIQPIEDEIKVIDFKQEGDSFKLTLNKKIVSMRFRLYADGEQIPFAYTVENLNEIKISKKLGFVEGVEYQLVFDAGSLEASGGLVNQEELIVDFEYVATNEEVLDKVIHTSVLDETVQRYHTAESFAEKIKEIRTQYQINERFFNNVVLNHISTDTNVNHWLVVYAPEKQDQEIPIAGNWWGAADETVIGYQLMDAADYMAFSRFIYAPYLVSAPENTFPFITSLKVFDKEGKEVTVVGNEQITVRITFSRDMDITIPLQVRFGSAYPYGDHELEGRYIDSRTWEGKYKLTSTIENGIQYFTVENGRSATEDLELMCDRARFSFEIDTAAAQALIMQGQATETGVKLTWTQDDFDTLMGYNVYRSVAEDGLYTRVNSGVIPADTMEFFDNTVEPGMRYFYNFTVVQTDLSESSPSGKISVTSIDTMAPDIYHTPVYNATAGSNLIVSATVTDNLNIAYARIYYRVKGTEEWFISVMNNLDEKFSAIIMGRNVTVEGLEYYIEAYDGVNYTYKGTAETPYTIFVQETVSADAMGDVNGDGVITNLDALMILKAIDDKLNLTAEQFARADLDGDGTLADTEALAILRYVSGAAGSISHQS